MKNLLIILVLFGVLETCNVDTSNMNNKKQDSIYISMLGMSKQTPNASLPGSNSINIGGKITGLGSGKTVTLELNGNKTTLLTEDKLFQVYFTNHPKSTNYELTVKETTGDILCSIQNSIGIAETDITNADVTCTLANPPPPPAIFYTVGGTVTGLTGSITLSMSGSVSQTKTISTNGSYTFDTSLPENGNYTVSISVHSNTSFCYFPNANANHNAAQTGIATSNVTNVDVSCVGRITLNEIISNQNASCASNSADYIELKNISGSNIVISTNTWYLCDDACGNTAFNSAVTPLFAIPSQTFNNNAYLTYTQNDSGSFTFGLGSGDAVNLIYSSGGKNYLVERYNWSSHVVPARKSPDGDFSGTTNSGNWLVGPNTSCTKNLTNP
jgi:hypothetical protein